MMTALDEQAIAVISATGEDTLFRLDVRAGLEVTFDELVAALSEYPPDEVTPETALEIIATEIVVSGQGTLYQRAEKIAAQEAAGSVGTWLPLYRRLVRELTGQAPAAKGVAA